MTAPTSTTENAVPVSLKHNRPGEARPQGVPDEESTFADTSAQGTIDSESSTKVPFKDQVIAYAKKTRGAVLRKPTLKEHGDQILTGEASAWEPTRKE